MSTQSLRENNVEELYEGINDAYICMAKNYLLKERFGIDKGVNMDDFFHLSMLERILCEDRCNLYEYHPKLEEIINIILNKYR